MGKYKHLTVGDLHLYDREMRTTKEMVNNSRLVLDKLYEYLKQHEEVVLLNINGDIQHKTPTNRHNRDEVAYWRKMFRKIGQLMLGRFKKLGGYSFAGVTEEDKEKFKRGEIYPIFVTKGNHDMDNEGIHTFFDDLIAEGLIINPTGLLVQVNKTRTYFSYRNYGVEDRKVPNFKRATDIIALEHNDVLHDESLLWNVPKAEDKFISAEKVVKGTDVTILHHIHEQVDPLKIGKSILWQVGSIGRTAYDDVHKRDVGYGALMDFGNTKDFYTVEFDLIPYQDYFSHKKIMRSKLREKEMNDFSLQVEEYEIDVVDYKKEIEGLKGVDEDVKEYAIEVMQKIESRENK